jgi:hypothetical protein
MIPALITGLICAVAAMEASARNAVDKNFAFIQLVTGIFISCYQSRRKNLADGFSKVEKILLRNIMRAFAWRLYYSNNSP